MAPESDFQLPRNIDRFLAALSKLYAQDGERELESIIVNAQIRVHEEWSYDNWNGGTYGHALYLVVPEALFLPIARRKTELQDRIREDLNTVHNVPNEFVEQVFLELEVPADADWRVESGLLARGVRTVTTDAATRLWGNGGFRLFISHKSEVKKETAKLAKQLGVFGIACFVAHKDIKPTKAWQNEIENALASMDGFLALMTSQFHDSDWTDQEVGFALARGVPIIAVRMGLDPYGFIGKFQGLSCGWEDAATETAKLLINHPRMLESYIQGVRDCESFDDGNKLAELLPAIEHFDEQQIDRLVAAYNENHQVRFCYGFNGRKPAYYGHGLIYYLHELGTRRFRTANDNVIEVA